MANSKKKSVDNNIVDIDLSVTQKQKFRIDGDPNRILEINIQDMNMPSRLFKTQKEIEEIVNSWSELDSEKLEVEEIAEKITELDKELRTKLDYIFDTNLSEVTAPFGTMFDVLKGKFRYEYIIEVISDLYEKTISEETQLMLKKMQKHTSKYIKK